MKVLIIRAFPSLIDLNSNSYNQQEVGLATAFLTLGHEAGIVYFGGDKHIDNVYQTTQGKIQIYYRKAKVLLKKIALFEDYDDLKESYDMLILNEYDQYETYKTLKYYNDKSVIYHGPYYSDFNRRYNLYNKIYDILFLEKIKKLKPLIFTKSKLAKEYLNGKGLKVEDYLGVGLDIAQLYCNNQESNSVRKKIDTSNINLLYIGKLEKRRNIKFLLETFKKLVTINEKYHLIMIGCGEKEYVQELFEYIDQNDLRPNIVYEERLEQKYLPSLYEVCDCFLLPTSYEIWGMVLMEAMYFGCPVITTYNGGSSTLIKHGINGFILNLDVNQWVDTITENDFSTYDMNSYNRKILQEKCSWNVIAEKMLKTYLQCLGKKVKSEN